MFDQSGEPAAQKAAAVTPITGNSIYVRPDEMCQEKPTKSAKIALVPPSNCKKDTSALAVFLLHSRVNNRHEEVLVVEALD